MVLWMLVNYFLPKQAIKEMDSWLSGEIFQLAKFDGHYCWWFSLTNIFFSLISKGTVTLQIHSKHQKVMSQYFVLSYPLKYQYKLHKITLGNQGTYEKVLSTWYGLRCYRLWDFTCKMFVKQFMHIYINLHSQLHELLLNL